METEARTQVRTDIDDRRSWPYTKRGRKGSNSVAAIGYRFTLAIGVPFCGDAGLAQLVVRLICNQEVGGSIPSAGTTGKSRQSLRHKIFCPSRWPRIRRLQRIRPYRKRGHTGIRSHVIGQRSGIAGARSPADQ